METELEKGPISPIQHTPSSQRSYFVLQVSWNIRLNIQLELVHRVHYPFNTLMTFVRWTRKLGEKSERHIKTCSSRLWQSSVSRNLENSPRFLITDTPSRKRFVKSHLNSRYVRSPGQYSENKPRHQLSEPSRVTPNLNAKSNPNLKSSLNSSWQSMDLQLARRSSVPLTTMNVNTLLRQR